MKRVMLSAWIVATLLLAAFVAVRSGAATGLLASACEGVSPPLGIRGLAGEVHDLDSLDLEGELQLLILMGDRFKCSGCVNQLQTLDESLHEWFEKTVAVAVLSDGRSVAAEHFWQFVESRSLPFPAYFDPDDSVRLHYRLPARVPMLVGIRRGHLAFALPMKESFWVRVEYPGELIRALFVESLAEAG